MGSLVHEIEKYLKAMLETACDGVLEIQRSTLSQYFECVPSQINYVLSTRFTPAHGYIVETRRGGGGYIRIVKLNFSENKKLEKVFHEIIGVAISQNQGKGLLEMLWKEGLISGREAVLIKNMISENVLSSTLTNNPDVLRAKIIQSIISTILREDQ